MKSEKLNLILICIVLALLWGCKGNGFKSSAPVESFHEYICGVTSGEVKRTDVIIIKFTTDIVSDEEIGSKVPGSILSFSPEIKGKAVWMNRDAVEFKPAELLEWKTSYCGKLKLSKLLKVPNELSELVFDFYTIAKQIKVSNSGLIISENNDGTYVLPIDIVTSDVIDNKELEDIFSASQGGNNLPLLWIHQPESNAHSFNVQNIKRKDKKSSVTIEWAGNKIGLENGKGSLDVDVPSKNDFTVSSVRVVNVPDQFIEITFSDPVNSRADLRGLLQLGSINIDQISIERNIVKAYPSESIAGPQTLFINKFVESTTGNSLSSNYSEELNFGGIKPAVRLPGNGVIVPQSTGLYFPFQAVSLNAVDVRITKIFKNNIHSFLQDNNYNDNWNLKQVGRTIKRMKVTLTNKGVKDLNNWNAFNLDLTKIISVEPGTIYNIEIGFRKEYSIFPCNQDDSKTDKYVAIEDEEEYPSKDYESVYYDYYSNWEKEDNPCDHAYYSPYTFIKRNILGSNFGIIAKTDQNKKTYVYVTNLLTAEPETGVEVTFYDFQNQFLAKGKTNSEGMISVKTEFEPFLLIAQKDKQIGYLKIDYSTNLSLSNFDVSGVSVEKGLKGFIYGERGVWRPGDSVFVSLILEDKLKTLPEGHPLIMEVFNPKGQFIRKIINKKDERSIYPFNFKTSPDDPTGNWKLVITAGGAVFNKSAQIETVKPNRLKVELNFNDKILSSRKASFGRLESKWLHGMPASNLNARVDVSFNNMKTSFDSFEDYDFTAPFDNSNINSFNLYDGKLDNEGKADLIFDMKTNKSTSGLLSANFTTKVFEEGGDFSINSVSKIYSPYNEYVGSKIEWSYKAWKKLNIDEKHVVKVASVDENGKPISLNGIQAKLFALDYDWWYSTNEENLASYAGTTHYTPKETYTVNTINGKGEFTLTPDEEMWGRYLFLISSPAGHISGQVIYFGWDWGRDKQKGGSQVLALVSEKESYTVGEKISVGFPASKSARVLITIENGSGIIGQEWITNPDNFTEYSFKATPEMAPNIYVSICLIQPHGQTANDLPIRLYGVTPVNVEDPGTKLHPELGMPSEVRPLKEFSIKVKEKSNKAMDYTIAIVDEGLLDLTNFKTPDPWGSFYAREALVVKSYDMYNYVMGSFGSRIERMFAVGGSDNALDLSKKKADRFKPVVKVLGPFHLAANRSSTHKVTLPQYVGSVRTMIVAAGNGSYGCSEQTLPVREPLMVLSTLPRTLAPDETVDLPVTIFAMNESVKSVKVHVSSNQNIEIIGKTDTIVSFSNIGEKNIYFRIKSSSGQGFASVKVEAESGNEKTFHETELDVRPPNLPETESVFKFMTVGEKWNCEMSKFGIEGTNKLQLEVSSLPPLNLGRRLEFLIRYPHGCVEQTTSAVFPQLYLPKLVNLTSEDENNIRLNISKGIEKLLKFQSANGGMVYWPGNSNIDEWAGCYVGHFLIEAEKAGYMVPSNFKKDLMEYIRKTAAQYSVSNNYPYFNFIQSYRLFVLSLAGDPQISAMNRLKSVSTLNTQTKWMLAGAYVLASMKEAAYSLIDFRNMTPDKSMAECYGSDIRDKSIMLMTLVNLKEWEQASKLALEISKSISTDTWYSTQSTAFSLIALSSFSTQTGDKEFNFKQTINGDATTVKNKSGFYSSEPGYGSGRKTSISIENNGNTSLFVNVFNTGVRRGVDTTSAENGLILDVKYHDINLKPVNPDAITQGTDFSAYIMLKNKTAVKLKNVALTHLFPSGWEIINDRLIPGSGINKNSPFDYCDIRDDRVNIYFELDAYESKTFTVNMNAAYSGNFILSPVTCSEMYDNSFFAKTPGKRVKVIK